jgi:ParB family chromosome partitioning protein
MGISGEFSVFDVINSATRSKTGVSTKDFTEIWLSPYEVKEATENTHHECQNIESLADAFILSGQQAPTILGRVNGEYRIVDGHRRNRANIMLIERGYDQFKKVRYLYKDMTENVYELSLLEGNGLTQDLTPYEKTELAGRMKIALEKIRDSGEVEIKGTIRDIIGKYLGETSGQMGRYEGINNGLSEEAKEQFKAGKLGVTAAYETSRLPVEDQKIVAERAAGPGGIGAAQACLQAERSAENADQSAGIVLGINMSDSDRTNVQQLPEDIEPEAVYTLQQLLLQANKITQNELLVLQDILMNCSNRE